MSEGREVPSWRLGDHASVTYATDDECRDVLTGYVKAGARPGQRVVLFLDADDVDLARHLTAAAPDAVPGQLAVLMYGAGFDVSGPGRVQQMLDGLTTVRDESFAAGHQGLFVAGKMTWTLRAGFGTDELVAYESAVNRFFGDGRIAALCLYDRRRFDKEALTAIRAVHPGPLLRFTLGGWGAHLRLSGELDASNAGSLPSILSMVAEADSTVLLDASDLQFLDAAGAGTIVRFAASRPTRHTVVRCTRGVRQTLSLVGADTVPSLVLRDQVSGV
ncbi:MEDS domain-containing protein [Dactylosporangium sp. NBC_01737]|uniref:MEDS domain-containing protein n=1 Tax=Dactylosporangium sp. NBC_01737 TaxID=2975959 RepID=UPI002E0FC11E|nr:MEDS domain-containing protein [Dactylosporangium sp. NBC_01737]